MIEFKLPDMSCGHCVSAVTKACKAVDPGAEVAVDLGAKTVRVQSQEQAPAFAQALEHAGYPPAPA